MKKFIFKVLLPTFVLLGVVLGGIEMFLRSIPNDYKTQKEYVESNAENIKLLVLGSSSASRGFIPRYFDIQPAYNCAYSARSVDYDYYILEKYIDRMDSLEYVILDMNYSRLWWRMGPNNRTASYLKYYSIYWGITLHRGFNSQFELSTSFTDIPGLKYKYKKSNLEYDGYQKGENLVYNEQEWRSYAKTRISSTVNKEDYEYNLYYLKRIIKICQEKGVEVLMVWIPVDKTISDYYEKEKMSIINNTMADLQNQFENFIYLDFYNDSTFTYLDMKDADHLNREGAIKLTKKVNDYIINQ